MRTPNLQPRVFPNLRHAGRTTSKMMKQPVWKIWPMARHQDDPGRKMLEIHGNHCLENAYPLVNVNKKRWKITIFNGKTHYNWGIFNSYVKLPEGSSSKQFCPLNRWKYLKRNDQKWAMSTASCMLEKTMCVCARIFLTWHLRVPKPLHLIILPPPCAFQLYAAQLRSFTFWFLIPSGRLT